MNGKFKVKIPNGYLMVEEKGTESEYPGVFVSFSKDGKPFDISNMIACVEYDSCTKEIKTETYQEGYEEPNNIISYAWYQKSFKEQLESLCWEFDEYGKLTKTQW